MEKTKQMSEHQEKQLGVGAFAIKDSGKREEMSTGSRRDTQLGKPRPDLIPPSFLVKLAMHYGNGADKYGDFNWQLGQPVLRYIASLDRHVLAFKNGMTDEPHLIAAIWNLIAIDWTLDQIKNGFLPKELDNRPYEMQEDNIIGKELYKVIAENIKKANEE